MEGLAGVKLQPGDECSSSLRPEEQQLIDSWRAQDCLYECGDELDDLYFVLATTTLGRTVRCASGVSVGATGVSGTASGGANGGGGSG